MFVLESHHFKSRRWIALGAICAGVSVLSIPAASALSFSSIGAGSAPQGPGAGVSGMSSSHPGGILATKMQVAQDAGWVASTVDSAIIKVGKVLSSGQQEQIASESKLLDAQTRDIEKMFKQAFIARREARKQALFGQRGRALGACGQPGIGNGINVSNATAAQLQSKLSKADINYRQNFSLPAARIKRLAGQKPPALQSGAILPPNGSITSLKNARAFAHTVLEPKPPLNLPPSAQSTAQGKRYKAALNTYNARMSLQNALVRQELLWHTPTAPLADWAKQAWQSQGHTGTPPGVVKGRISPMALETMQVNLRDANPAWYKHLYQENKIGVLRELALMRALSLRIQLQRLKLANHRALVDAAARAVSLHHSAVKQLNQLRNGAVAGRGQ